MVNWGYMKDVKNILGVRIDGDLREICPVGESQAVIEEKVEQQIERHTPYPPPHRYARVFPLPEEGG